MNADGFNRRSYLVAFNVSYGTSICQEQSKQANKGGGGEGISVLFGVVSNGSPVLPMEK